MGGFCTDYPLFKTFRPVKKNIIMGYDIMVAAANEGIFRC